MANSKYEQLLKDYVNAPYDVLLAVAQDSLCKVMPYFNSAANDGNGAALVLPFICVTLAVDGKFTDLEYKFMGDLVGGHDASYDDLKNIVQQYYSAEWIEAIDKVVDACPAEINNALISFCLAFAAVDETISREENAFIAKLIA